MVPRFWNRLVPSLQQSVWTYARNTNLRLCQHLQALLTLSVLQAEHFMAQAVWNRYCGQQHKYWICQESWHCVQHICNCNLAPTRSNSKQPLRNNIFSPSLVLFLKKLRESLFRWLSAPRCCIQPDWEANPYVHTLPHTTGKYSRCCPCPRRISGVLSISAAAVGE